MIEGILVGIWLACTVSDNQIKCVQREAVADEQTVYIAGDTWEESDIAVCDVYNLNIGECWFESIDHCQSITDDHAQCLTINLEPFWSN